MDSRSSVLLAVLAFMSVLQGSYSIRCYQCSSRGVISPNSQCADPIDKRMLPVECTTNVVRDLTKMLNDISPSTGSIFGDAFQINYQTAHNPTMPMCQKLEFLIDNRYNYTVRSCINSIDNPDDHCRKLMATNNAAFQTTYCGICTADGCNGSSSLVGSLVLSVALPAALVAFLASSWTRA